MHRSLTESKNAPRRDAVPEALATAPSSKSGTAARMTSEKATTESAAPIAIEAPTAVSKAECRQVIGGDAGAADVRSDGLQATLEAGPPPSVEHVRSRDGDRVRVPAGRRIERTRTATTLRPIGSGEPGQSRARGGSLKTYPTPKIRNVALVGHSGAGKTTLAEALLLRAGAINGRGGSRRARR